MNQKKIAELANVSPSTVSKALNGQRDVHPELAERIRKIAIENGYVEEKGRRMITNRRDKHAIIAVFCPEIISIQYSRMVTKLKKEIEALGGEIAVYIDDFSVQKAQTIANQLFLRNGCDGMILLRRSPFTGDPPVPVLCFDEKNHTPSTDHLISQINKTMDLAIEHLKSLGHTRIGYVGERLTETKKESFCLSMRAAGLEIVDSFFYEFEERFEECGYAAANRLLQQTDRPTALVCAYDEIALGAIHILSKHGIRTPGDISFVGINDIPFSAYAGVELTSVETFSDETCKEMVALLFSKIFSDNKSVQSISVTPRLIVRRSTASPKE